MKKFLLLFSVFALFACKKDSDNSIPASDYELSADGLTLVKWKNENTSVLDMQADGTLSKVKIIGEKAFYTHKTLGSITLPNGLTNIGAEAFYATKINSITIPAGVQVIGKGAFMGSFLTTVQFSEGLITIDEDAFSSCQISILKFPESLQAIGAEAFYDNNVLVSVTIPKNVQNIGKLAFSSCKNLTTVTFKSQIPPRADSSFSKVEGNLPIAHFYVPKGTAETYKKDEFFKYYTDVISEEP